MGDYTNQKPSVSPIHTVESSNVDVKALAEHLAKLLTMKGMGTTGNSEADFDTVASMERLAKSMIVQRGDKTSNFDDLGEVKTGKQTEQEQKDVQNTIDLLNKLE